MKHVVHLSDRFLQNAACVTTVGSGIVFLLCRSMDHHHLNLEAKRVCYISKLIKPEFRLIHYTEE